MHTKAGIFNLALGALLLNRQVSNADTDTSNEARVLRNHYDLALYSTLEDLDLDSTATRVELTLVTADPNDLWLYAYAYPSNCAFVRRILPEQGGQVVDNRDTHIPKRIQMYEGEKVIFTNEENAYAEVIESDIDITTLSSSAGYAIALKLAFLAAPLCVGKGAAKLRESILEQYKLAKAEAQESDTDENFSFVDEDVESEFVNARMK